mmetsp:Transcript_12151/g.42104  ORF Transcript_12151/g.42104 Transcript_12151/m.42104 type:complete len:1551 (-) Transcript_12151:19-4671(-)
MGDATLVTDVEGDEDDKITKPPQQNEDSAARAKRVAAENFQAARTKNSCLGLLTPKNPLRQWCLAVIQHKWFDRVVTALVMINCLFLALWLPLEGDDHPMNRASRVAELVCSIGFTLEMVFKMISIGIAGHRGSYLRDTWNQLDFIIVVFAWLSMVDGMGNFMALRTIRLLRPLRTISSSPNMQIVVRCVLESIPMMLNVFALWAFLFLVFCILGMQLWEGIFHWHCVTVDPVTGNVALSADEMQLICAGDDVNGRRNEGRRMCPSGLECRNRYSTGRLLPNPNNNISTFDNFGWSFVAIFQVLTREGWTDLMNMTRDGWSEASLIFWLFLMLFGSFLVVNLATAVIFAQYVRIHKEVTGQKSLMSTGVDEEEVLADLIREYELEMSEKDDEKIQAKIDEEMKLRGKRTLNKPKSRRELARLEEEHRMDRRKWQIPIYDFVKSDGFGNVVLVVIILNTVCLAMEHDNMSSGFTDFLAYSNYVFTVFFSIEMVLKLAGLGIVEYVMNPWDLFDGVIVIVSIVEVLAGGAVKGVSVLRCFRLLRVMKVLRNAESIKRVVTVLMNSLAGVASISVVLFILIFTYALLGMQMFAGAQCAVRQCVNKETGDPIFGYPERVACESRGGLWRCEEEAMETYNNSYYAFLTTFQILTAENWHLLMFASVDGTSWAASLYYLTMILLGHYFLLNLFLAGVVRNVAVEVAKIEQKEQIRAEASRKGLLPQVAPMVGVQEPKEQLDALEVLSMDHAKEAAVVPTNEPDTDDAEEQVPGEVVLDTSRGNRSLYLFAINSPVRVLCLRVVKHQTFDNIMVVCICVSSLMLAIEDPWVENPGTFEDVLSYIDLMFTAIFLIEAVLKLIAYGLWAPPNGVPRGQDPAYLDEQWNRLDGTIVVFSLLSLGLNDPSLRSLKALRTLRALRPLRLVSKEEGMKNVITSLFLVAGDVGSIVLVLALVWLIFAILGVNLFGGQFGYCPGGDYATRDECEEAGFSWKADQPNFDNVGQAMLTLFEIATLEDWPDVMYMGMSITGKDRAPVPKDSPIFGIYFVAYVVFGALFSINLVVAAVVNQFMRVKMVGDGSLYLSPKQQLWVDTCMMSVREKPERKPPPPKKSQKVNRACWELVTKPQFDYFITLCIMLNVVVMAMSHYDASSDFDLASEVMNSVFTWIFVLEMILKVLAFGVKQYLADRWNVFDCVIVWLSIFGFIMQQVGQTTGINPSLIRIFRIFRAARILRMIRGAKGLRMLLRTFVMTLPALWNIGLVLFLVFFIFAILGMYLVGDVPRGENITQDSNFESFGSSMLMLFRSCTGEGWNSALHEILTYADDTPRYWLAIPFYIFFLWVVFFIMLNLFVAVVLENFTEANRMEQLVVSPTDFAKFADIWSSFDPLATYSIPSVRLEALMRALPPPLGVAGLGTTKVEMARMIGAMDLPSHGEEQLLHYHEVLSALAFSLCGSKLPQKVEGNLSNNTLRAFPTLKGLPAAVATFAEVHAVIKFQAAYKGHKARKLKAQGKLGNEEARARIARSTSSASHVTEASPQEEDSTASAAVDEPVAIVPV